MAFDVKLLVPKDALAKAMDKHARTVRQAGSAVVREITPEIVKAGRARISAAGFSKHWVTGYRHRFYKGKKDQSQVGFVYHKKGGLASVWEYGADIRGRPLLWVPLKTTPAKIRGKRTTAKRWADFFGPLFRIESGGKHLLMGQPRERGKSGSGGRMVRGAKPVPLFVGLPSNQIAGKWGLRSVWRRAPQQMARIYERKMRDAS